MAVAKGMLLDELAPRTPVNVQAASVTWPGDVWEPQKKVLTADQCGAHKVRKYPNTAPPGGDLTGLKRGRLVVLGLSATVRGRWVVRCSCGTYSMRTAKAIKNEANWQDRCEQCRELAFVRRDYFYQKTGKELPMRDAYA